ncbi:hypothetical protein HaLaN_17992, partial [Haematococcus lacustris]
MVLVEDTAEDAVFEAAMEMLDGSIAQSMSCSQAGLTAPCFAGQCQVRHLFGEKGLWVRNSGGRWRERATLAGADDVVAVPPEEEGAPSTSFKVGDQPNSQLQLQGRTPPGHHHHHLCVQQPAARGTG